MIHDRQTRSALPLLPLTLLYVSVDHESGMSYPMLKEIVDKMKLTLPDARIRKMFNLMDVNHDKSLDLAELLDGFEVLFGKLIPDLIFEAVGVSSKDQLKTVVTSLLGLMLFFIFIGLAFSSLVVSTTSILSASKIVSIHSLAGHVLQCQHSHAVVACSSRSSWTSIWR